MGEVVYVFDELYVLPFLFALEFAPRHIFTVKEHKLLHFELKLSRIIQVEPKGHGNQVMMVDEIPRAELFEGVEEPALGRYFLMELKMVDILPEPAHIDSGVPCFVGRGFPSQVEDRVVCINTGVHSAVSSQHFLDPSTTFTISSLFPVPT